MDKKPDFRRMVDQATDKINELGRKASHLVNQALEKVKFQGNAQEAYLEATYVYEVVGTTDLIGRPYTVRGFLIDDELELLIRMDQENQGYVRKNVALRDKNDKSLIQIDQVYRDNVVYVDLNVGEKTVKIACFLATYKAFDKDSYEKNVVKVEEDKIVGKAHISKD